MTDVRSGAVPRGGALPPMSRRVLLGAGSATVAAALVEPVTARAEDRRRGDGAPYAYYWFPDSLPPADRQPDPGAVWRSLLDWSPAGDPDLQFNVSTVPLARRATPTPAHPGQHVDETRVQSLVSFGPTASNPSQGSATSSYYAFTHWSYVDELVFWGGSAGEGIVLAPNAPVVDAAHRAGVPVLGNVFLPPVAYGGLAQWTLDLCQEVDGRFPVADKLAEVARTLGFDGWFVNAETDLGLPAEESVAVADRMRRFLQALEGHGLRTTWYDALTEAGEVVWQNRLTEANDAFLQDGDQRVSDTMFVNFWWNGRDGWVAESAERARSLGRSPYDLYQGIDTEAAGYRTQISWEEVFPSADQAYLGSLGLYRPEWTKNSLGQDFTLEGFQERDHQYWVGGAAPAEHDGAGWPGVAAFVPERTTVDQLPFTTAFGTGAGRGFSVDGALVSDREWNHLGLQDVLPHRRWATGGASLDPRFDYDVAYQAGESLAFSLHAAVGSVELFWFDDVTVPSGTPVQLVGRGGAEDVVVRLTSAGGTVEVPAEAGRELAGGWYRWTARTPDLGGAGLCSLGLGLRGSGTWNLGELRVGDLPRRAPAQVSAPRALRSGTGVRVWWRQPEGLHHVEVHADGRLVGATSGHAFYVDSEVDVVTLVSVSEHYVRSRPRLVRISR